MKILNHAAAGSVIGAIGLGVVGGCSPAPTPEVFVEGGGEDGTVSLVSLSDAQAESTETGKPVFALVTSDWCATCQNLKRTTLADETVASWISEHTVPVYLEWKKHEADVASLGVKSFPTAVLVHDGEVIAQQIGSLPAEIYLDPFIAALAQLPADDPSEPDPAEG